MGSLVIIPFLSHLTEVMVFFRLLEVKGFSLLFTRPCQQVVKHVVVPEKTNVKRISQQMKTCNFYLRDFLELREHKHGEKVMVSKEKLEINRPRAQESATHLSIKAKYKSQCIFICIQCVFAYFYFWRRYDSNREMKE